MSIVTKHVFATGLVIVITILSTVIGPALDADLDPVNPDATEIEAFADTEADLRDAIAQAQAERPDLWDAESKARAHRAIAIAAQGTVADR